MLERKGSIMFFNYTVCGPKKNTFRTGSIVLVILKLRNFRCSGGTLCLVDHRHNIKYHILLWIVSLQLMVFFLLFCCFFLSFKFIQFYCSIPIIGLRGGAHNFIWLHFLIAHFFCYFADRSTPPKKIRPCTAD